MIVRPPPIRSTHTYAELDVSRETYDEIKGRLDLAGYEDKFDQYNKTDGGYPAIDMQGIAVVRGEFSVSRPSVRSFTMGIIVGVCSILVVGTLVIVVAAQFFG